LSLFSFLYPLRLGRSAGGVAGEGRRRRRADARFGLR
jgi:hypothetical protein